ncbi:hypothetical protein ABP2_0177 [Bacillus subtilis subsp. subtilis]|nr:hypothetical protein [Bacillus subtilis subsp. subtilis]
MDRDWFGCIGILYQRWFEKLQNPKGSYSDYPTLIKESDLHYHLGLSKAEVKELLEKFPGAPKIELKGTVYYPYQQFLQWMSSIDYTNS